jgi:hypothetical protein
MSHFEQQAFRMYICIHKIITLVDNNDENFHDAFQDGENAIYYVYTHCIKAYAQCNDVQHIKINFVFIYMLYKVSS